MKTVKYTDRLGRHTNVLLPDDVPDIDAYMGVPLGPPSLDALGLPPDVQTRLHNELFARGIFNVKDVQSRRKDVIGALMSALKVDADMITRLYTE